eukprot:350934-Chlamydomonas_euryale.AAC.3
MVGGSPRTEVAGASLAHAVAGAHRPCHGAAAAAAGTAPAYARTLFCGLSSSPPPRSSRLFASLASFARAAAVAAAAASAHRTDAASAASFVDAAATIDAFVAASSSGSTSWGSTCV